MDTNIRKARMNCNLSQKEVALTLKVSAPTVSDWESEKTFPSASNLIKLSQLYSVSTDYLLGLVDTPFSSGKALARYIRMRRGRKSTDEFASECQISPSLLTRIEEGFHRTTVNPSSCQHSLSSDEFTTLAAALSVDDKYLMCLHDGINPHRVQGVAIPDDDMTKDYPSLELDLQLFSDEQQNSFPAVTQSQNGEAWKKLYDYFEKLNEEGQERLMEIADDMVRSGKYIKSDKDGLAKEA